MKLSFYLFFLFLLEDITTFDSKVATFLFIISKSEISNKILQLGISEILLLDPP